MLKNCWDILKCENRTFLTLVAPALLWGKVKILKVLPFSLNSAKRGFNKIDCQQDQDLLLNELRRSCFCDVFECNSANLWCCFLCNHPERAIGFLQDSQPVIDGQLKEKKGHWKLFKRWKTRYFTLSGAHLSYKESVSLKIGWSIQFFDIIIDSPFNCFEPCSIYKKMFFLLQS